jgi:hypothetical protein
MNMLINAPRRPEVSHESHADESSGEIQKEGVKLIIALIQEPPPGGVTNSTILLDLPPPWIHQIFPLSIHSAIDTHSSEMANTEASPGNMTDFGDFVKDEEEELDLEELVEPWHRYETEDNQNVLYPIRLGEVLNERYLVEHKLGFGGGSTVWMAFDLQDKRDVALKVMARGKWGDNETRIQDEIIKTVQDTSRLVIYTATFFLPRDDKSDHRVLVFPMKGPSICTLTLKRTPMASRMSAAR